MQLKLLQFYRLLSNLATHIIGAFVPLLIYKFALTSGFEQNISIMLTVLYFIVPELIAVVLNHFLKKWLFNKPQLFLLLRIIPITILYAFIILLEFYPLFSIIGMCIASPFVTIFKQVPNEVIYNYVSVESKTTSLGYTRFIEQIGYIAATILGALFLDNLSQIYLAIISFVLYLISVIPLVLFYIKNKKTPGFNVEGVSTAVEQSFADENEQVKVNTIRKKFCLGVFITFFLTCFIDMFYYLFSLWLYINGSNFLMAGIAWGVFDGAYAIGCIFAGYLNEKKELKWWACAVGIIMCLLYLVIIFVDIEWLRLLLFAVNGGIFPILTIWHFQATLSKAHILGVGNHMILNYNHAINLSYVGVFSVGLFGALLPCIIVAAVGGIGGCIFMVFNENKQSKRLVDFLHRNDENLVIQNQKSNM